MTRELFEDALMGKKPVEALEALQESGELAKYLPEIQAMVGFGGGKSGHKDLWHHTKVVVSQCKPDLQVRWAALFHDCGKVKTFSREGGKVSFHGHEGLSGKLFSDAAKRTKWFRRQERSDIRYIIHNLGHVEGYDPKWTDSAVRRVYKLLGNHFSRVVALARADITTKHRHKHIAHRQRLTSFVKRAEKLAAKDAIPAALPKGLGDVLCTELGLTPSKELGDLMSRLRAAVEVGDLSRQAEHSVYLDWVCNAAHKYSMGHRDEVSVSERCGCFYCSKTFEPSAIKEWTDNGTTALCPHCGIDSVIGSASEFPITDGFLARMNKRWFSFTRRDDF